jgi:hypothetical protein
MDVLVEGLDRVEGMTSFSSMVYYVHRAVSVNDRLVQIWRVGRAGAELAFLPQLTVSAGIFPDEPRDRLIFMSSSPLAIHLGRNEMRLLADGKASGEAAADEQYVYWPHYENARYGAIKRVAIDTEGTPFP